jgi:hypothetical protein
MATLLTATWPIEGGRVGNGSPVPRGLDDAARRRAIRRTVAVLVILAFASYAAFVSYSLHQR